MRSPHKHWLGNLAIHLSEEDLFDAGAGDSSATAGLFKTGVVSDAFPDVVGAVGVLQPPAKSRTTKKGKRGDGGRRREGGDVRQVQVVRILLSTSCHLHPLLSHKCRHRAARIARTHTIVAIDYASVNVQRGEGTEQADVTFVMCNTETVLSTSCHPLPLLFRAHRAPNPLHRARPYHCLLRLTKPGLAWHAAQILPSCFVRHFRRAP